MVQIAICLKNIRVINKTAESDPLAIILTVANGAIKDISSLFKYLINKIHVIILLLNALVSRLLDVKVLENLASNGSLIFFGVEVDSGEFTRIDINLSFSAVHSRNGDGKRLVSTCKQCLGR